MLFITRRVFLINLLIYMGAYVLIWILNAFYSFGYTWGCCLNCLKLSGMGLLFYAGVRLVAWLFRLDFFFIRFIAFMVMWMSPYRILTEPESLPVGPEFSVPSPADAIIVLYGVGSFVTIVVLYLKAKNKQEMPAEQEDVSQSRMIQADDEDRTIPWPECSEPQQEAWERAAEQEEGSRTQFVTDEELHTGNFQSEEQGIHTQTSGADKKEVEPAPYCPNLPELTLTRVLENGNMIDCTLAPETLLEIPGQVIRIGRAKDAHVRFTDASVSKYHIRLGCDASGYWIEDKGSLAGTAVNGVKCGVCQPVWLNDGDRLQLGNVVLIVRIPVNTKKKNHSEADEENHTHFIEDDEVSRPWDACREEKYSATAKGRASSSSSRTCMTDDGTQMPDDHTIES